MKTIEKDTHEFISHSFKGLDMSSEEIKSKSFEDCTFNSCNFSKALFNGCTFTECHFVNCNLSLLNLECSKLMDVSFDECKMVGIDWTKATWSSLIKTSQLKFDKCILTDSSFLGLELEEIIIEKCNASGVDFRDGNFKNGNFEESDFTGSLFNHTNLNGANFVDALNYDINLNENKISGAKFSRLEAIRLLSSFDICLVDG